ncbi:cytochrome c oxidase accessory protein CcoG [Oryzibacter oryziterrae]|uniref:cytochrome c oxidase accessory protein CcoG n=1 Tax=Oryzibacter oryziterrae TaxID=2766474 RepID=UPI001F016393|nr:cytochrome c oxidase accessory protein CcoG [Oryzibacter oryziterrae]
MRVEQDGSAGGDGLYSAAKKNYPAAVSGRLRTIKWAVLMITLGIYYLLPFIRWDRGPNSPDQAVLIDMTGRRAYFFFIEIWPQEVYYLTGLLVIAAITLFLMNAVAGRVWCGYLCPQTVWTDLFFAVERLFEGDRRDRIQLDKAPWSANKIARKGAKHATWLLIAWWTGGAWVLYFGDAPTMVRDLITGNASFAIYMWIGILTFTTYALAGFMREQVCVYMCPWPRIQAALTDEWALNVTYRSDRGEQRMSTKAAAKAREAGQPAGDCIDCYACVNACPTGVDIREGMQLGCIQCGLCIDACDTMMERVGREPGLIGYDTDMNIERRKAGKQPIYRIVRARTVLYTVLILGIGGVMLYTLMHRTLQDISVLHDRNPLYVELSTGGIRNGYTVRFINKRSEERSFSLDVNGLPQGSATIEAQGIETVVSGLPVVTVAPDDTRELRVVVTVAPGVALPPSTDIIFRIVDMKTGESARTGDFFKADDDHGEAEEHKP